MKKTPTEKAAPKAKAEKTIAVAPKQTEPAAAKKPSPAKLPSKKPSVTTAKPATETPMPEQVGLTAGKVWHFLNDNGPASVAKLIKALPEEEEKTVQRSIGWLAQEGKITLETIDRVETIALT